MAHKVVVRNEGADLGVSHIPIELDGDTSNVYGTGIVNRKRIGHWLRNRGCMSVLGRNE
jgi:aryl-alcohol dehydrogenase-like predicted oxidoreductase